MALKDVDSASALISPRFGETRFAPFFLPHPRPAARLRLFCLPFAGGMPWAFRSWATALTDEIELCAVCLPGRAWRVKEPVPTCMTTMAQQIAAAMQLLFDKPYAIFGHSFGALCAYSVACEIAMFAQRSPIKILVSACSAPDQQHAGGSLYGLPDEVFMEAMERRYGIVAKMKETPELLDMTLSLLRSDLKLAATLPNCLTVLTVPITAFFGTADPETSPDGIARWRSYTSETFSTRGYDGGHFFLFDHEKSLISAIEQELLT
jgi:surfactin synthase thioesterase subunit